MDHVEDFPQKIMFATFSRWLGVPSMLTGSSSHAICWGRSQLCGWLPGTYVFRIANIVRWVHSTGGPAWSGVSSRCRASSSLAWKLRFQNLPLDSCGGPRGMRVDRPIRRKNLVSASCVCSGSPRRLIWSSRPSPGCICCAFLWLVLTLFC